MAKPTPRQASMLERYDASAAQGNNVAAAISLALRLLIHRRCTTCAGAGWESRGGPPCPECFADGIVTANGNVVGRPDRL